MSVVCSKQKEVAMGSIGKLLVVLVSLIGGSFGVRDPTPGGLKFSDHYETKGVLSVPQAEIREPFHAWFDARTNTSRIDFYDGSVKTYQLPELGDFGTSIQIVPVHDREDGDDFTCWRLNGTVNHIIAVQSVLPDVSKFKLVGEDFIDGVSAEKWELQTTEYSIKSRYTLWVRYKNVLGKTEEKTAIPVRYQVHGINNVLSSRNDHFFLDYDWFSSKEVDANIFQMPQEFEGKCEDITDSETKLATSNPMREYIKGENQHIMAAFEKFKQRYDRHYSSPSEEAQRLMVFRDNYRYIMSTNRANRRFQAAINHLADRLPEEIRPNALPMNFSAEIAQHGTEALLRTDMDIPSKFDWVMQGAVTRVKDQAQCAACWSFAATGALEGAHFVHCGRTTSLSEQALLDCSSRNRGCIGGTAGRAFQWAMTYDGLPTSAAYGPYKGLESSCRSEDVDLLDRVRVANYRKVRANIDQIKIALMTKGPMAIAYDSTRKSFASYKRGVYDYCECEESSTQCNQKLVHAGALVGFGVHKRHGPYWVIKNSWGEDWGINGYILIPQKISEDCGISIAPYYVEIENCLAD